MAKIVVTGAGGKAGRAVVRALLERDYEPQWSWRDHIAGS
jgi:uncharacterized protein YbjT (DUF2867 family)